ncbi:hypothetical protein FHS82_001596 [Pseudochelatococcus lubricantis]|uniref:DUF3168 domain-containing protein n=1 Tax=Pseudochelatococcus lubricantis TaxID=1538102 RepID=A0ABX0V1Q5_9HYPH|nr:DUF3168 domain-containing protein [Pseudochelatococcus lubricantis]NIJ57760.1 hypothetical protein [Pseudochelatococcus lubricantis]
MSGAEAKGPVLALREAIVTALAGDAALTAMLGGATIRDEVPRGARGVYAVFSETRLRDWSTGSDQGHEQDVAISVWSVEGGARMALRAAARIGELLDGAALTPDGHRLVNLRVTSSETRRDTRADRSRVVLRLRAVTEVLSTRN